MPDLKLLSPIHIKSGGSRTKKVTKKKVATKKPEVKKSATLINVDGKKKSSIPSEFIKGKKMTLSEMMDHKKKTQGMKMLKKGGKKIPDGYHKMPDGRIMKNSAHKSTKKK
jgi:hypothetical protein